MSEKIIKNARIILNAIRLFQKENKNLQKIADQMDLLIEKWERNRDERIILELKLRKQNAENQELQKTITENYRRLRDGIYAAYGRRDERLRDFGLQPLKKAATKESVTETKDSAERKKGKQTENGTKERSVNHVSANQ